MVTENEIRNQLEIAKTKQSKMIEDYDNIVNDVIGLEKYAHNDGYIHALSFVLGQLDAKYNKEDI